MTFLHPQSNKPLMEKKRRQRINRCLNDLKSLVLEGMKKDVSLIFVSKTWITN